MKFGQEQLCESVCIRFKACLLHICLHIYVISFLPRYCWKLLSCSLRDWVWPTGPPRWSPILLQPPTPVSTCHSTTRAVRYLRAHRVRAQSVSSVPHSDGQSLLLCWAPRLVQPRGLCSRHSAIPHWPVVYFSSSLRLGTLKLWTLVMYGTEVHPLEDHIGPNNCPEGQYLSTDVHNGNRTLNETLIVHTCRPCHQTCKTCFGPNDNQCLTCPNSYIKRDVYCITSQPYNGHLLLSVLLMCVTLCVLFFLLFLTLQAYSQGLCCWAVGPTPTENGSDYEYQKLTKDFDSDGEEDGRVLYTGKTMSPIWTIESLNTYNLFYFLVCKSRLRALKYNYIYCLN